jgi:molecular chaperone DnaJ
LYVSFKAAMRLKQQDYYEVLGVSRDASGVEIKRAFRGLARSLHPDVAADSPVDSFHEVVAAYEVLSHPKKRSLYDRLGFWGRRRPAAARPAPAVPPIELTLAWYEADRGAAKQVEFEELLACSGCAGRGVPRGVQAAECVRCRGSGRLSRVTESATLRLLEVETCPVCGGVGHAPAPTCLNCGGSGVTTTAQSVRVRVPPGVRDGDLIQVEGVERRFRLNVGPRPRDSSVILLVAGVALACALGLLFFLLFR